AALEHGGRRAQGAVAVAVGLHDAAHGHADDGPQHADVRGDRRAVDVDPHQDSAMTVDVAMPASWLIDTCRCAMPSEAARSAAEPRSSSEGLPSAACSTT